MHCLARNAGRFRATAEGYFLVGEWGRLLDPSVCEGFRPSERSYPWKEEGQEGLEGAICPDTTLTHLHTITLDTVYVVGSVIVPMSQSSQQGLREGKGSGQELSA